MGAYFFKVMHLKGSYMLSDRVQTLQASGEGGTGEAAADRDDARPRRPRASGREQAGGNRAEGAEGLPPAQPRAHGAPRCWLSSPMSASE